VLRAITATKVPTLTAPDLALFQGLVADTWPRVRVPRDASAELEDALRKVLQQWNFEEVAGQVSSVSETTCACLPQSDCAQTIPCCRPDSACSPVLEFLEKAAVGRSVSSVHYLVSIPAGREGATARYCLRAAHGRHPDGPLLRRQDRALGAASRGVRAPWTGPARLQAEPEVNAPAAAARKPRCAHAVRKSGCFYAQHAPLNDILLSRRYVLSERHRILSWPTPAKHRKSVSTHLVSSTGSGVTAC
jgi:Hydrolytic ATP binding site of dynein motor region